RLERAQRVARHDPAHPEAFGKILLGSKKVTRAHLLGEQRLAHPSDDPRRQGGAAKGEDLARFDGRMQTHARVQSENIIKIISFAWTCQFAGFQRGFAFVTGEMSRKIVKASESGRSEGLARSARSPVQGVRVHDSRAQKRTHLPKRWKAPGHARGFPLQ